MKISGSEPVRNTARKITVVFARSATRIDFIETVVLRIVDIQVQRVRRGGGVVGNRKERDPGLLHGIPQIDRGNREEPNRRGVAGIEDA